MAITKIILFLISAGLLAFGWIQNIENITIWGAIVYLIAVCISLSEIYKSSRDYRDGKIQLENISEESLLQKIEKILGNLVGLSGLVAFGFNQTAGWIMWIGTILAYCIGGIIINAIANIPLKWGSFGSPIIYPKKRRKK